MSEIADFIEVADRMPLIRRGSIDWDKIEKAIALMVSLIKKDGKPRAISLNKLLGRSRIPPTSIRGSNRFKTIKAQLNSAGFVISIANVDKNGEQNLKMYIAKK